MTNLTNIREETKNVWVNEVTFRRFWTGPTGRVFEFDDGVKVKGFDAAVARSHQH
jgi:hypothetical protein